MPVDAPTTPAQPKTSFNKTSYRAFDQINDDSRVRPWLHQMLANVGVDDASRLRRARVRRACLRRACLRRACLRRDDDKTERFSCDTTMSLVEPSIQQQLGLHIYDIGLEQALADPQTLADTRRQALIVRFVDGRDDNESIAGPETVFAIAAAVS